MTLRNKLEELGKIKRVNQDEKGGYSMLPVYTDIHILTIVLLPHAQIQRNF